MYVCKHTPPHGMQGSQVDQTAETDMHAEYACQRQHLEHSMAAMRKKLSKDTEIHRVDSIRVMQVRTYIHTYTDYWVSGLRFG